MTERKKVRYLLHRRLLTPLPLVPPQQFCSNAFPRVICGTCVDIKLCPQSLHDYRKYFRNGAVSITIEKATVLVGAK